MNCRVHPWFLLLCLIALTSCDESFSPKVPLQDNVVIECIIEGSFNHGIWTWQAVALVSRVYDVPGTDPSSNTQDPTIKGATVLLLWQSRTDTLVERSVLRTDSSRYHTRQTLYSSGSLLFVPGETVMLRAVLPDGRVLTSKTIIPPYKRFETMPPYGLGVTTIPKGYGTNWILSWEDYGGGEHLFFPSLRIQYTQSVDTLKLDKTFPVPMRYVMRDQTPIPVYPTYQTEKQCIFEFDAMDAAMRNLSAGDPVKQNYKIWGFSFSVLEYDYALSRYYSSTNGYLDQFSLRLDESIYSNINGGLGVFGSCVRASQLYQIHGLYAEKFGYLFP